MKKYEGLIILNAGGKEESIKDAIDKISAEITSAGGKVETVQKMDKKNFSRVADKRHQSGFYVNIIFESKPEAISSLRGKIVATPDVFRVLITDAPAPKEASAGKLPVAK